MKAKWLLQQNIFDEACFDRLVDALKTLGIEHKLIGYVPFGGGYLDPLTGKTLAITHQFFPDDECIVAYGSINLCSRLMERSPWTPTAWFDLKRMSCQAYYANWGEHLLQQKYVFLPFGELPRKKEFLMDTLGGSLFIKPDANTKKFTGAVVSRFNFDRWLKRETDCYEPDKETLVVAAEERDVREEWRTVICDGQVVTWSMYCNADRKKETKREIATGALELARRMAKHEWQPDAMYVLDICRVGADDFAVIEIGSVNCSGLYDCDMVKFAEAATKLAERQWKETNG